MGVDRAYMRLTRYIVQAVFLVVTLVIGHQFYLFIQQFIEPGQPFVVRPPSVDAFMPIAGFMSFKYFLFTGTIEPVHPAALVMFIAIAGVSFIMKKGFCGWICPIGTISQYFWMAGKKIFGRNFIMDKQFDIPLRAVKYLLMAMFIILIGIAMTPNMMVLFFITDYYKSTDVRTMQVFTSMSTLTLWVLIALGTFSLVYKNFWCRYLCPYGALLGLLSSAGPVKIKRNDDNCIRCGSCSKSCPSHLHIDKKNVVHSPECFSCMTCISRCQSDGALNITVPNRNKRIPFRPLLYPTILIILFYLIIGIGMATDKWHSQMHRDEYGRVITELIKK
jgi:polyferredoxin